MVKKNVVPDNAITASGRMVQCGSCGLKWRQYPVDEIKKTPSIFVHQKNDIKISACSTKNTKTKKNQKKHL